MKKKSLAGRMKKAEKDIGKDTTKAENVWKSIYKNPLFCKLQGFFINEFN